MTNDFLRRAEALVAQMTLEERLLSSDTTRRRFRGSEFLNTTGGTRRRTVLPARARRRCFLRISRISATFDLPLVSKIGEVVSTEARAKFNMQSALGDRDIYKGLTFWAPNVNIFRDPRWGRGQETYGEDPYLTARMGVAYVHGIQGSGKYLRAAACAKHFAVHSGPEKLRHEFDAEVSEKDLRGNVSCRVRSAGKGSEGRSGYGRVQSLPRRTMLRLEVAFEENPAR